VVVIFAWLRGAAIKLKCMQIDRNIFLDIAMLNRHDCRRLENDDDNPKKADCAARIK